MYLFLYPFIEVAQGLRCPYKYFCHAFKFILLFQNFVYYDSMCSVCLPLSVLCPGFQHFLYFSLYNRVQTITIIWNHKTNLEEETQSSKILGYMQLIFITVLELHNMSVFVLTFETGAVLCRRSLACTHLILLWARERGHWHVGWQNLVFSEQSRLNFSQNDGRLRVGRNLRARFVVERQFRCRKKGDVEVGIYRADHTQFLYWLDDRPFCFLIIGREISSRLTDPGPRCP